MFKLCLLACCWLVSFSSSSITRNGQLWRPTYVSQGDLDLGFVRKVAAAGNEALGRECALKALGDDAVNLICYVNAECVFYELLREAKESAEAGVTDAVRCLTRYAKGARPCLLKKGQIILTPFGCLLVIKINKSFNVARQHCISLGMDLVSLELFDTTAQLADMTTKLDLFSPSGMYYVGFQLDSTTNKFFWLSTGNELRQDSILWGPNEPSFGQDYGIIITPQELHDSMDPLRYFICSFP